MNKVEYVKKLKKMTSVEQVFANADDSITIVIGDSCRHQKTDFDEVSLEKDADAIRQFMQDEKKKSVQKKMDKIKEDFQ